MMTTLETRTGYALLQTIAHDDCGDHFAAMLLYADWLRERGRDDDAFAWEWLARRRLFPALRPVEGGFRARFRLSAGMDRPTGHALPEPVETWLLAVDDYKGFVQYGATPHEAVARLVEGKLAKALRDMRDAVDLRRPS